MIAYLLRNNNIQSIKKTLSNLRYDGTEISKIIFLISIQKLDVKTAFVLKKLQEKVGLTEDEIKRFAGLADIDKKLIDAFIEFELSVNGNDVMKDGFAGAEIGKEIERREKQNFEKLL